MGFRMIRASERLTHIRPPKQAVRETVRRENSNFDNQLCGLRKNDSAKCLISHGAAF
jgi:hypothetical protein